MRPIERPFAAIRMEEHEMLFPDPFHFVRASILCSPGLFRTRMSIRQRSSGPR